jgi:hypothetical protein
MRALRPLNMLATAGRCLRAPLLLALGLGACHRA